MNPVVRLRAGRAKPVWAGHPWVLSGAVDAVTGEPGPGDLVDVHDHLKRPIGRGFYAPASRIRVRMLTTDPAEEIDRAFFERRLFAAGALRRAVGLPSPETNAYRAVHGSGDGLPGVVADRYGEFAVLQLTVRGMEDRREEVAQVLAEAEGLRGVRLNAVRAFATREDLVGAEGDLVGEPVPEEVEVRENGLRFLVDTVSGQKTGHYADHRENRARLAGVVRDARVLDAFCGTGGFAVTAAAAGARSVRAVDSSAAALDRVGRNAEMNGVADRVEPVREDVFRHLRSAETRGERFGAIVLDPPRMAARRRELKGALRGYKELNLRAMRLLDDGGVLATASCTGLLSEPDFLRMLRDAALDAKRRLTVIHAGGQGPDHPWSPMAPEGRYLKFVLARVTGV